MLGCCRQIYLPLSLIFRLRNGTRIGEKIADDVGSYLIMIL